MEIIRFKISSKNDPEIFRVIEIESKSNFEKLHQSILASFDYNEGELASFYLNYEDNESRMEICLSEMQMDDGAVLMKDMRLKDVFTDENKDIIYIYDFINFITFQVDFIKKYNYEKGDIQFPVVIEEAGEMPKQEDLFGFVAEDENENETLVKELLNKNSDIFDDEDDEDDMGGEDYFDDMDDFESRGY